MKPLPSGPWEVLFQRALRLIDDIQRHGGLADPFWTLGGGTVLMFRYGHRLSKDIDIFVPDPQYLGYVTPRLSDTAAALTEEYTEMPGSFVKLQFEEGEVDFVAAPNLIDAAWEQWEIQGRPVRVETAAEVIAKKMYHRGDRATALNVETGFRQPPSPPCFLAFGFGPPDFASPAFVEAGASKRRASFSSRINCCSRAGDASKPNRR